MGSRQESLSTSLNGDAGRGCTELASVSDLRPAPPASGSQPEVGPRGESGWS